MNLNLTVLQNEAAGCGACSLNTDCNKKLVWGEGNTSSKIMFIGEGPGETEDEQGRPFVGVAGQLLDKMIKAMGLKREDVYITNVVKHRPPNNRVPTEDEAKTCSSNYLEKEIAEIKPKIIVTLGNTATAVLLKGNGPRTMSAAHGKVFTNLTGIKIIPTYHPAALLRNEDLKEPTWEDLQKVMKLLEETE